MARLAPLPFAALLGRIAADLDRGGDLLDLPARRIFRGSEARDLGVRVHGARAATPFGPAAGPHTQLAQNIVLSWLAGARVIELKTVQALEAVEVPRPCIDMETVGYNVEWSQELTLEESLEEYVKASMIVRMLAARPELALRPGAAETRFDVSLGYSLDGIRSEAVGRFLDLVADATPVIDRLRRQVPPRLAHMADVEFDPVVADSVTLSTFHGCPPEEIALIAEHLMVRRGLHTVVKLNPTLNGPAETRRLLGDRLGYTEIEVPDAAFAHDPDWPAVVELIGRLQEVAASSGRGFGVKLTNTLVVVNHRSYFPASVREMYLSGAPLHVLAMRLVGRLRETFGSRLPLSFSAGIDRHNFADAVAVGLAPVTACSDLLKKGGYGRAEGYLRGLSERMEAAGAPTVGDFVIRAFGQGAAALARLSAEGALAVDPAVAERAGTALATPGESLSVVVGEALFGRWVAEAARLNTPGLIERTLADPRYRRERIGRPPRKIGRQLRLFDCLSCDLCVSVCPNDANVLVAMARLQGPRLIARARQSGWSVREAEGLETTETRQVVNFADFCNDCGNCDVFCPEEGGPFLRKPRFFGTEARYWADPLDGFFVEARLVGFRMLGRFEGTDYRIEVDGDALQGAGPGFAIGFSLADPARTLAGEVPLGMDIDLTPFLVMAALGQAVLGSTETNWVQAAAGTMGTGA